MSIAHVPQTIGTFRCRICKKLGDKSARNQNTHGGCALKAQRARDHKRRERNNRQRVGA